MQHKPDALMGRQVAISGSLINTRRSFCQNCEYNNGFPPQTEKNSPHTPELSTTRSFPGVRTGALVLVVASSFSDLTLLVSWGRTPPITPSTRGTLPLISAGSANAKTSAERMSISGVEQKKKLHRRCFIVCQRVIEAQSSRLRRIFFSRLPHCTFLAS